MVPVDVPSIILVMFRKGLVDRKAGTLPACRAIVKSGLPLSASQILSLLMRTRGNGREIWVRVWVRVDDMAQGCVVSRACRRAESLCGVNDDPEGMSIVDPTH